MQDLTAKKISGRITIFTASLLLCGFVLAQQRGFHFNHLSEKEGLSSNRVQNIIQDHQGFYWIATADGLNRFDGSSFKVFRYNRNDSFSIANNNCITLLEGDEGDIWIATMKGVSRYLRKQGVFRNYVFHHAAVNDNILNAIQGLAKDEAGAIWAVSYGVWKIDPADNTVTDFLTGAEATPANTKVTSLSNLSYDPVNKGLWMYSDSALHFFDVAGKRLFNSRHNPLHWPVFGLKDKKPLYAVGLQYCWAYDRVTKLLYRFEKGKPAGSPELLHFTNPVSHFSVDGNGNPVFSFELVPAVVYNHAEKKKEILPVIFYNSGIKFSGIVSRIYTDRKRNKWLCTPDGVFVIANNTYPLQSYSLGYDPSGFPNTVHSFVKQDSTVWMEVRHHLYKYDLISEKLSARPVIKDKFEKILYNAGDTLLWLGRDHEIMLFDSRTEKIITTTNIQGSPYFALAGRQATTWVGTWDNGLYELDQKARIINHYTEKNGLAYNGLICGWYDGGSELWLGMNGGRGFAQLNLETRKFEDFSITAAGKTVVEFNSITSVSKDSSGHLWLGTYGGGIYCFNKRNKQYQNYQRSQGLSGDYINTLAFDKAGNLWISTMNGIDVMSMQERSFRHIYEPMQQVNNDHINNLFIDKGGSFFYSAANKIISFHAEQYISAAEEATILVSGFKIAGREWPVVNTGTPVRLSYRENFFSIEYSSLRLNPEIPIQYRCKLEGFNKDWIYSTARGVANFTNVPPGRYKLLLNATNTMGKWNNTPLQIIIIIEPPFWKTWWFYLLSALLTGCLILLIVRSRIRQFKKRQTERLRLVVATQEKEKKNISAELHDDLGVRLSALKYFVTSLKKYLSPGDVQAQQTYDKTIAIIDESVEDIRYLLINLSPKTLHEYGYLAAVEDLVNKLSQLHIINISLRQTGMEKRLDTDTEAGLYRITQELINNTLKHSGASAIELVIEKMNGQIRFSYRDDGNGFLSSSPYGGYGIENIQTRVALLGGKIDWDTSAGKPVKVNIVIPYNHT
jgi:signal transduction histidine kinase/ligand-binding sensor domain-containing protein